MSYRFFYYIFKWDFKINNNNNFRNESFILRVGNLNINIYIKIFDI